MKFYSVLALAVISTAAWATAETRHVPYVGGVQTGVLHLKGTRAVPGSALPDTVVFDGALRLAAYLETQPPTNCSMGPVGYHFLVGGTARAGFRKSPDSVWTSDTMFPSTALHLDTLRAVQHPNGAWLPSNLPDSAWGMNVALKKIGGLCYGIGFEEGYRFQKVMYFQWRTAGQTRYGKLMARSLALYTSPPPYVTDGAAMELDSVEVIYTLFDSTHLDPAPMALKASRFATRAGTTLMWHDREGIRLSDRRGNLYDLRGNRILTPLKRKH